MSSNKLARGMVEIPKGVNTGHSENSTFMNVLERTNVLLVQFLSSSEDRRMMMRTELEESYFNITLYNLKDSIKNKIEQDMWNNLFKKHVSELQGKMKSKDKVEVTKAQSELSLFLDEAMGFYSKFLDVLSLIHNIRLPGRPSSTLKLLSTRDARSVDEVSEQDLYYIAQHCFVHLGDLSRYHNLHKLARLNYQWAVQLNPTSGHAYNQLAILESSSVSQMLSHTNYSHLLRTILYYDFANSCQTPFPATRINLDSLLRHIHQESVSELLTSNNSIDALNCLSSFSVAWLHTYATMRLHSNVHRCRQLQQRLVEWTGELVKHHEMSSTHWRDIVTIVALQCGLLSAADSAQETTDALAWNANLQQFTQDLVNALCHSLVSISHDVTLFDSLFTNTGCVSALIVFVSWLHHYVAVGNNSFLYKITLSVPFGEQFVKLLNILQSQIVDKNSLKFDDLPIDLPELQYLSGYEPMKIQSKRFDIFSKGDSTDKKVCTANTVNIRKLLIVSVATQIATNHKALLLQDTATSWFANVPVVIESVATKKILKTDPQTATRKPVNVALQSIKSNVYQSRIEEESRKNVPNKVNITTKVDTHSNVVTDVKIAKCIQDHIALETTNTSVVLEHAPLVTNSHSRDDNHGMAPAPGLILSSNLPPEYKTMSSPVSNATEVSESHVVATTQPQNDLNECGKSAQPNLSKIHSYNPNREQFEKDLPPRFANKRSSSQKENKSGFKSLNYWDSTSNIYQGNVPNDNCDVNLTKKESEMMTIPPTVPTSWLNDDQYDRAANQRRPMDTNITIPPSSHYQFQDSMNQQRTTFNNTFQQNSFQNIFQPSFNQYQNNQTMIDQDNAMKHYLQTTSSHNPNSFSYQTNSDMMDHNGIKLNSSYLPTTTLAGMQHNFPPIPPPPTQPQHQSSSIFPIFDGNSGTSASNNYDQFTINRTNNYDKPIFSSSNQTGFVSDNYSNSPSMISQRMAQQQQKQSYQVRSNNPLLNLLPDFINNEMQR